MDVRDQKQQDKKLVYMAIKVPPKWPVSDGIVQYLHCGDRYKALYDD